MRPARKGQLLKPCPWIAEKEGFLRRSHASAVTGWGEIHEHTEAGQRGCWKSMAALFPLPLYSLHKRGVSAQKRGREGGCGKVT